MNLKPNWLKVQMTSITAPLQQAGRTMVELFSSSVPRWAMRFFTISIQKQTDLIQKLIWFSSIHKPSLGAPQ